MATLHNRESSLAVPLCESSIDDSSSHDSQTSAAASKKTTTILLVVSLASLLLVGAYFHSRSQDGAAAVFHVHDEDEGGYGVDVSWPIHSVVTGDNDYRPMDERFARGSRHAAYVKHLQGCRRYYARFSHAAARTCDTYEFDRLLMNRRQPQSMENYTDIGFQKVQAPPRVAMIIDDFWEKNKDKQVTESWPEGNIYLNHWDAPSRMVSVDDTGLRGSGYRLKLSIWQAAQKTISAWAGGQEITPVSMYGIRVYTNGSLLVPHVDRLPLVASAMISVAQDVDEPWPTEVYSHKTGKAHNVTLQPGEMLLFESHSVVHGRPFPMKGRFSAFLFIHFEPTGQTPLKRQSVEEQYKQAVSDSVGGQSSSAQSKLLPPYIRRFSPEEEHWQQEHPEGWRLPAMGPASFRRDTAESDSTTSAELEKEKEKQQQAEKKLKGHEAARDGDVAYWTKALVTAHNTYELIHRRDSLGWQPIHESAVHGHTSLVELLLAHGANINARTNGGRGGTPLFLAQQQFGPEHPVVVLLIANGALSIPPDTFREEL